jgi:hypothetical protein
MMRNNKRGSVTVFLTAILPVFLLIIVFLAEASAGNAAREYAKDVLDLAGRSILSEYDRNLKENYGLFGLIMDPETAEHKLDYYVGHSLKSHYGKTDLFDLKAKKFRADLSGYALTDPDRLEKQIQDYMQYRIITEGLNAMDLLQKTPLLSSWSDDRTAAEGSEARTERILKNRRIIDALPSRQLEDLRKSFFDFPEGFDIKSLAGRSKEEVALNLYILRNFRHNADSGSWKETFFVNEVEYILCGRLSDKSNRELTDAALVTLRTSLNLAHIYADMEKREAVVAAAAIITPGPEATVTQLLIAALWAGAEADNDLKRLTSGKRVPLYKTADDWVIDLDYVLNKNYPDKISLVKDGSRVRDLDRENDETISDGLDYENYLFLLLCFKSRESKLLRIMDLIQLDMEGNHYADFRMGDCYGGIDFACTVVRESSFLPNSKLRTGEFLEKHVY